MKGVQSPLPRSMTVLFGEDAQESQPLWFNKDVFLSPHFDSESYIADLRRFVALDTLRTELKGHLSSLKNELLELINKDYADFVNLSTKLVDVEAAVSRMRAPLTELRTKISSVRDAVDSSLSSIQDRLQRRALSSSNREVLELLLDTSHVISKVEKLMVELQCMPEEGLISHTNPDTTKSYSGNSPLREMSEKGTDIDEARSLILDRIGSEMNRLKFYIARAQNLPFIQNMEKRIQNINTSLDNSLCHCFEIGLQCHDVNIVYNCLRAYAAIDNIQGAEETFRSTIVSKYVQQVIPPTPLKDIVGRSADLLDENYKQIENFVKTECKFLLDIAASENSGLHVFDFLANSILKEVLSAIQKGKSGAFSPGKPTEFLKNYKSSMGFLSFLEGCCSSESSVTKFRMQPVYTDFLKQWNLGAYFTLRFQEIASALDSALTLSSITFSQKSSLQNEGPLGLMLNQSIVLLDCLHRCWHDDVYISTIADKFLRLTLQLLSRYSTWLSSTLKTHKKGSLSNTTNGTERPIGAVPEDFILMRYDVDLIVKEVEGPYLEHVLRLLSSCPPDVLAQVKESILHASQALYSLLPLIIEVIVEIIVEKCVDVLKQVKGITATYRMTNKPPPVRHSPYVSGILKPLKAFLEGEYIVYLTEAAKSTLLESAAEKITTRFHELAQELVTVARRTESSLQRIRQGAQRRGGAGMEASDNNISDTDKICMQLFLDVQEYGRCLTAIGVSAPAMPIYSSLWQCVAPPEKQASITL